MTNTLTMESFEEMKENMRNKETLINDNSIDQNIEMIENVENTENIENATNTTTTSSFESKEDSLSGSSIATTDSTESIQEPKEKVLNFTSNNEIESIFLGEENIDIVGYVDDIQYDAASEPHFRRFRFYKIVLNNGEGKRIQITAWNERSSRIFRIDRLYTLVHVRNLTAHRVDKIYNLGNVDYELLVQNDTEFTTYGRIEDREVYLCNILEAMTKIGSQIRIEGYIKSPLQRYKQIEAKTENMKMSCMSSVTDGTYMMDLRLPIDAENLKLQVGEAVSIIGVVLDEHAKPPKFYVESLEDIKRISDRKNMPLEVVYMGNKYPKRVLW